MRAFVALHVPEPFRLSRAALFAAAALLPALAAGAMGRVEARPGSAGGPPLRALGFLAVEPGPGVTSVGALSDYEPSLRGADGDSPVYFLDSGRPGATLLVVGGTHPDEPAGVYAAAAIVERATAIEGRIIAIPLANALAMSGAVPHRADARNGSAGSIARTTAPARLSSPESHGVADPPSYSPPGSSAELPGYESRNLNRAYPGDPSGSPTERVARAIMELLRRERVDLAFDLHEAPPDSPLAMTIVAHERALGLAAAAILDLEELGIGMRLEASPESMRGLSHREWGDRTEALAFLVETPEPEMDSSAYGTEAADGRDGRTGSGAELAGQFVESSGGAWPLWRRALIHLAVIRAAAARFSETAGPGRGVRADLAWDPKPSAMPLGSPADR